MVFSHVTWGRPGGLFQFSEGEPLGSCWHLHHHPYVQCAQIFERRRDMDYRCKVRLLGRSDGTIYRELDNTAIYRPALLITNKVSSWHNLLHLILTKFSHTA